VRVAGIEQVGGVLELLEVDEPRALRDGEVLIEVKGAGVGNWDDIVRVGDWDVGRAPPMALGVEAAGVVTEVGPGVQRFEVGDEVLTHPLPFVEQGAWAPRLIARAELLARKPSGLTWAIAGAFPVPALTAIQVIDEALKLRSGETLLVNGAGGATGGLIVSVGAVRGARVLATAGPASSEQVGRAGALDIVDYHDPDWPEQIVAATHGRGVDAAANAAPGGAVRAVRAVRDGGRLATITSDPPEPERGIDVGSAYVRPDGEQLEQAAQLLTDGKLPFRLGARFPLADARAALARAVGGGGGAVSLEL
jgi:NADPH:quinone reductase-like Zn-dependent oxidoreductase